MDKERLIADLKKIAGDIDYYAESLLQNTDKLRDFTIYIRLNTDGENISTWEVSQEFTS